MKIWFHRHHGRETAERCFRKLYFNVQMKKLGIPREQHGAGALNTGSIFHAILEARYLNFADPVDYAFSIPPYDEYPKQSKDQHNQDFITLTFISYCNHWPEKEEPEIFKISNNDSNTNDGNLLDIPALEYHWIDDEPVENSPSRDQGFIDRIVILPPPPSEVLNDDGIYLPDDPQRPKYAMEPETWEIWPTDTKTTSQDIDSRQWYHRHVRKIQFALYMRNLRNDIDKITSNSPEKDWRIPGFMVDSIMHSRSKRKFRRLWLRDEYTVEKCNSIIEQSDETMRNAMEEPDTPNYDACMDFRSPCQFYDLCHSGYKDLPLEERMPTYVKEKAEAELEDTGYQKESND